MLIKSNKLTSTYDFCKLYDSAISSMSKQIEKIEDARIIDALNLVTKDLELINSLKYEELPLYLSYKFNTDIGTEFLSYRIKNKCLITLNMFQELLYEFVDHLI